MSLIFHQLLIPRVFQNGLTNNKIGHPISANQSFIVVVLNGSVWVPHGFLPSPRLA